MLPKAVSILSNGLAVHVCSASVVFDSVAVGPRGREASIVVRAVALYSVAVDSDTVAVHVRRPSAGSGMPVPHASDVGVHPVAANNRIGTPSIQAEPTNILVGVAEVRPESLGDDLCEVAVGSGARANYPGTVAADPEFLQKAKPVAWAPASRWVKEVGVATNWLISSLYLCVAIQVDFLTGDLTDAQVVI